MIDLAWALSIAVVVLWLATGWRLLRRPLPVPRGWPRPLRRIFWAIVWLAALFAGSWGPHLGSRTLTDHPRASDAGMPVESTTRMIRTPFVVQRSVHAIDAEGRVANSERHLSFQLPVLLLLFFGVVGWFERSAPTRREGLAILTLAMGLGASGCGGEGSVPDARDRPERVFVEAVWDTISRLALAPDDTLLFTADAVAADSSGFWVLDRIGRQVGRFGWDGRFRGYAGRPGGGPGEFMAPQIIDTDDAGRLWVLDRVAGRVSGFEQDGTLVETVPLGMLETTPHSFGVSRDGRAFFMVLLSDALEPVILYHEERRLERGSPILVPDAEGVGGIRLQGTIARARDGDDWVYALTLGDGMFRMKGAELVGERIWFPEAVPFSPLVESFTTTGTTTTLSRQLTEPNFSAREVVVVGDRILVRFYGATDDAGRLVDRYDLATGAYIDSSLLPRSAAIGGWGDRRVLVSNDPLPEIVVLRRRDSG